MGEHAKQTRILIADDDRRVLFVLRAALERMNKGCQIVAVRNGTEALRRIKNGPFDLVITDVRMPGLSGIELVEAIRDLGVGIAAIWITAYGCDRLQKECDRLAVYRCLEKPLRINEIRQAALEALQADTGPEETGK